MDELEIVRTLNEAVHTALLNGYHELDEHGAMQKADEVLATMPVMPGNRPSAALLLRRYHASLYRELCRGSEPVATPAVIEDELRMLTRAVMVAIEAHEGISVEASVLLAQVLRAQGLKHLCALPPTQAPA